MTITAFPILQKVQVVAAATSVDRWIVVPDITTFIGRHTGLVFGNCKTITAFLVTRVIHISAITTPLVRCVIEPVTTYWKTWNTSRVDTTITALLGA